MARAASKFDTDERDRQRFADRVLGLLEDAVYWAIAVLLVAGSVALLIAQFNTMLRLRNTPASTCVTNAEGSVIGELLKAVLCRR